MRDGASSAANTVWAGDDINDWIRADLGSAKTVEKIGVAPINSAFDGWGAPYLDGAKIQSASSTGGPWTDRANLSGHVNGVTKEYAIGVSARYWRISATSFQLAVGEFRIYELDPGVSVSAALPALTVSAPAATVAIAAAAAGAFPSLTVSAPAPTVTAGAAVAPALPAIIVSPPAGSAASVTGVTVDLPAFAMSSPQGAVTSGAAASGALPAVVVSPPSGQVTTGAIVAAVLPSLTASAPIASVSGGAMVTAVFAAIDMTAPTGTAEMIVVARTPPARIAALAGSTFAARTATLVGSTFAQRTVTLKS